MKTTVYTVALIFGLSASGLASAQTLTDTWAERLQGVKHVSMRIEERLAGYIVQVYTPPQREDLKVAMDKYEFDRNKYLGLLREIDERRKSLAEEYVAGSRDLAEKRNALTRERNSLKSPTSPLRNDTGMYEVLHVGSDYIEVRRSKNEDETILIPFSRIAKLTFSKDIKKTFQQRPDVPTRAER